jgi:flagellar L-ring protein FlgH
MKTILMERRDAEPMFVPAQKAKRKAMTATQEMRWFVIAAIGWLLFMAFSAVLLAQKTVVTIGKSDPAAVSLADYVRRVKEANVEAMPARGSIWSDAGRFTRMSADMRAMRPHDLISVVVTESLSASTVGSVANTRSSSASSQISALMGLLHAGNAMQNLVNQNSAAALAAKGDSETSSSLNTTLGGQVVEVLPNGMLVIEAARQVEYNQQTQTIVLHGLVRPEDISQQNQVVSTAISSLELEVRGKGIINDFTHRQNPLVRLLNKILIF